MAGGGSNNNSGGSHSGTPTPTGPFTWNGASSSSTFDPKDFGTKVFGDLNTAYGQGPKINPVNPFTDYSQQTKDFIGSGIDLLKPVASGGWLNGGNPFFEQGLADTRQNILQDVGSQFTNSGRFGGGSYVNQAVDQIARSENPARMQNFENEYQRMLGAQGQGLGLSGLLDSKNAEKTAADATMWDRTNNAPFNHLAQYLGLLNGSGGAEAPTNKPTSFWDILGGIGSTIGSFF